MELGNVVPPRRRLARVGILRSKLTGHACPVQRAVVARQRWSKADLYPGAGRAVDWLHPDNRRGAIAFGTKLDPAIAGENDKKPLRGEHGAGHHAQTIAERAA